MPTDDILQNKLQEAEAKAWDARGRLTATKKDMHVSRFIREVA